MDSIPNPVGDSPPENRPPPIPQRSHARGISSNVAPSVAKRPPLSTIVTGGLDNSRSRSETVSTSSSIRNRRQGYVPRKNSNMMSLGEMSGQMSAGSMPSAPPTAALTPPHSRAPSSASNYKDFLAPASGGDSGAVSPVDGSVSRANLSRRLASLPESRNSTLPTINSIRAVKRVLFMLFHMYRPIADIALQLKESSPKRYHLERQIFVANTAVEDLDKMIVNANSMMERNIEIDPSMLTEIMRTGIKALQKYVIVVKDLSRQRQQTIKEVDAFHIRLVLNTAHGTIIEARNVCHLLGFKTKALSNRDTLRVSTAFSSRTVTPTQPKSASSRRRGPTILPSGGSVTNLRGMAPPVPLNTGSRTNTMSSTGTGVPPRRNDSISTLAQHSNAPSRSNTMRSTMTEGDSEDMHVKLQACFDTALQLLPPVRAELVQRKQHADRNGDELYHSRSYAQAINRCEIVITTNNRLLSRLRAMKGAEPARVHRELLQMAESFGRVGLTRVSLIYYLTDFMQDWTNFATEIVNLAARGINVTNIRRTLKPLQVAVKDANRTATLPAPTPSMRQHQSASAHGALPPALNTAMAQTLGYVPPGESPFEQAAISPMLGCVCLYFSTALISAPAELTLFSFDTNDSTVPATPLGAALGPAVQATVPPTPTTAVNSPEHYFPDQPRNRPMPDRSQTTLPPPSYPRRDRT